ncbi:MAG: hypothetical protein NC253_02420 [Ruminococcus sp.]|nr:hypothetical protein [Ruminococcus sp.]MCM1382387.1 hypothetical protein [Muribaculaceae bacterium]MCM1478415.1 hypothetical protein [Muribaculaceae bacterium]
MDTLDLERKIREEEVFDEETVIANKAPDVHILINKYIHEKEFHHADIIRKLNVERSYGYQILNGRRVPTRTQIIKIGIIMKLSFEEVQRLLKIAGKETLYARNLVDARIIYSLERKLDYDKACEFIWGDEEDIK